MGCRGQKKRQRGGAKWLAMDVNMLFFFSLLTLSSGSSLQQSDVVAGKAARSLQRGALIKRYSLANRSARTQTTHPQGSTVKTAQEEMDAVQPSSLEDNLVPRTTEQKVKSSTGGSVLFSLLADLTQVQSSPVSPFLPPLLHSRSLWSRLLLCSQTEHTGGLTVEFYHHPFSLPLLFLPLSHSLSFCLSPSLPSLSLSLGNLTGLFSSVLSHR